MLDTELMQVPLSRGLSTKEDPNQVQPPKVTTLQNVVFTSPNEMKKRPGYTALGVAIVGGGNVTTGVGSATFKSELLTFDGFNLYSYSPGLVKQSKQGANVSPVIEPISVQTSSIYTSATTQDAPSVAYDSGTGLMAYCWRDLSPANLRYSIVDTATGQSVVAGNVLLAGASTRPKVAAIGGTFVFWVINGTNLQYAKVPASAPNTAISFTTGDGFAGLSAFDVTAIGSKIFGIATATGIVRIFSYDLTTYNAATPAADTGTNVAVWSDGTNPWFAWNVGTTIKGYEASPALGTIIGVTTLGAGISGIINLTGAMAPGSSTTGVVWYSYQSGSGVLTDVAIGSGSFTSGGAGSTSLVFRTCRLYSKAFSYNGSIYAWTSYFSTNDTTLNTYFLVDLWKSGVSVNNAAVVGKLAVQNALVPGTGTLIDVASPSAGVFVSPYSAVDNGSANGGVSYLYGLQSAQITFGAAPVSAEVGGNLHISGGILYAYDGVNVKEHGFHLYPEILGTAVSAGGSFTAGTYSIVATYEWVDAQGQLHRSAPSAPASVTTAGGNLTIAATVRPLCMTSLPGTAGPINIVFYVTQASGSIYYYLGQLGNNTTTDEQTLTASLPPATSNLQLYTTSGQVANSPTPSVKALTSYKSRLIMIPADNPYSWWFSQQYLPASGSTLPTPVQFSALLSNTVDSKGGQLTACIQMDDKLVLGKQGAITFTVGDGPSLTGANSDYIVPQYIQSPVGMASQASCVSTPDGIMFQASNSAGIWLLTRGLGVIYVGAEVEAYNSYTVTSAVLNAPAQEVRFTLSNGTALVYNYCDDNKDQNGIGQWSVFTNVSAVSAVMWQGAYTYLKSNGTQLQEAAGSFTDNGTNIYRTVTTAWIKLAGLSGYARIRALQLLGTYVSASTVQIQVAYDYGSVVQTDSIVLSSSAALRYLVKLARQKCEAIQITISDTAGAGEGSRWSAITLQGAAKKGLAKLPPTQQFG